MKIPLLLIFVCCAARAEFRPVFNGRDLTGWVQEGPRRTAAATSGELRISGRGHVPNWIHTADEYENFHLRFEYKLAQWAEAAVILRAPRTDRPQPAGITLMLAHDFHKETTPYITGGIAGARSPLHTFPPSWEVWHRVDLTVLDGHLQASIDGLTVQNFALSAEPTLAHRMHRGVIGFPDLGYAYAVRNVEIEDLGAPTNYVSLSQIASWEKRGDSGEWREQNGIIEGSNGHSILYAPPSFADFEFTAVVRSHNRVNSGVFFRGQPTGPNRGFEVQIYSPVDAVYPTGSIYGKARSQISADLEDRWFLFQVRVVGNSCKVWIDGEPAAVYTGLPVEVLGPGRIGLQIHLEDASVEFRDVRVRPISKATP